MTRLAACGLSLLLLGAQQRPDFSGRWATEREAPPAQGQPARGTPGTGWGPSITVTQDSARLVVEYPFYGRYDMQPPLRFVYALNGSETKSALMVGQGKAEQVARATWDGATLVLNTTYITPHPSGRDQLRTEVVQRIRLDSPTTLTVETTRSAVLGGAPSTTTTIYRKQ